MKKFLISLVVTLLAFSLYAQNDVTTFLGIPVDGTKSSMRQKLISKGFIPKNYDGEEYFEGEFNGTDVQIFIVTNNNKVYRIMVSEVNKVSESQIKIRFNNLVHQFENNERYSALEDYTIPDAEDISYEMMVHKKEYGAIFYQNPDMSKVDTLAMANKVVEQLRKKYTDEQLENPTEEMIQEYQTIAVSLVEDWFSKKEVWFRIAEFYGKYCIVMYYDNVYNQANGEDL